MTAAVVSNAVRICWCFPSRSANREMTGPVISRMAVPAASTAPIPRGLKITLVKKRGQKWGRDPKAANSRRRDVKSDRTSQALVELRQETVVAEGPCSTDILGQPRKCRDPAFGDAALSLRSVHTRRNNGRFRRECDERRRLVSCMAMSSARSLLADTERIPATAQKIEDGGPLTVSRKRHEPCALIWKEGSH